MMQSKWMTRLAMWAVPGSLVLGTSCATEMRDAAINAGATFVGNFLSAVLTGFLPAA